MKNLIEYNKNQFLKAAEVESATIYKVAASDDDPNKPPQGWRISYTTKSKVVYYGKLQPTEVDCRIDLGKHFED